MPADLLLVRHGQSTWNAEGRWQGQADPPLTRLGEEQATLAAAALEGDGLTAVASSDLARARRTAEIAAAALGLGQVAMEPGLREFDVGDWCGRTRAEIESAWPGQLEAWFAGRLPSTPGGEARAAFSERVVAAVTRVAAAAPAGARLLVVTHGGVVRAVERAVGAEPLPVPNLSGRWFHVDGLGPVAGERVALLDPGHRTASPSG